MARAPERRGSRAVRTGSKLGVRRGNDDGADPPSDPSAPPDGYASRSRQPLEILALLLPLIAAYEAALVHALRAGDVIVTNRAHAALLSLFEWAGVRADRMLLPALSLPGLALVAVLLSWQALSRRPWTLHLPTVGLMAIESILVALPLVAVARLTALVVPGATMAEATIQELGTTGQLAVAIGAGIYEELVFRLVLVSFLHSFFRRVVRLADPGAAIAAVAVAALLFAFHHPVIQPGGVRLAELSFLLVAGLWWGSLFVVRGFGIAVGSHAAYDAWVLLMPTPGG